MFQAVRERFSALLSHTNDACQENASFNVSAKPIINSRKRRQNIHLDEDDDDDYVIVNPQKRYKSSQAKKPWILNIYEYIVRKAVPGIKPRPTNTRQMSASAEEDGVTITSERRESHIVSRSGRKTLTPVRRTTNPQRNTLPQISNAAILDLTNIDDEDSEKDVEVTKVSIDLTQQQATTSCFEKQFEEKWISRELTKPKNNRQPPSFMMENFRLEEKKRYKEILAQYTTVTLPDYSESILPNPSPVIAKNDVADLCVLDCHVPEELCARPLGQREVGNTRRKKKLISIDLTNSQPRPYSQTPLRKNVDLTRSNNSCTSSGDNLSKSSLDSVSYSFTSSQSVANNVSNSSSKERMSKSSVDHSIILSSDWIKKMRENLDPIQLARERLIRDEEKKKAEIKKKQLEELEKLSKKSSNEFPELNEDMLSKIKRALSPGNASDVFVEGFNAQVTRGDVATLRESTWLNDEVVNFYFNLIKVRSEENKDLPKIHVFNTFFYPKIMKMGHSGVKRWTRKVDIFLMDLILIPVHLGMHWCLAVVDFKDKEIVYYDSLKGNNSGCIQALKKYLQDESKDKKKTQFDYTGWKELMPKNIPEQMNGCDCGVFMCKYAEYKSRYADFTFEQDNMPYFRKRMIYEILTKKLM